MSTETPQPVWRTPHPATAQILRWLDVSHLPAHLADYGKDFRRIAADLVVSLPNGGPELTTGLRKLVEAKDCIIRAAILQREVDDTERAKREAGTEAGA